MSLITRQSKGSRLTIEEMDNNLLYLESLSGNTNLPQAKIGSDTNYSQFDDDGSLRFFGSATVYNDQVVDILTEITSNGKPLTGRMFRNTGQLGVNYAQDFFSNSNNQYGIINLSGYTEIINAFNSGTFSISFWVKPQNVNSLSTLFSIPVSANFVTFAISTNAGGVLIQHNNIISGQSIFKLNADSWYHICYTQKNTQGTLYVNNISSNIIPNAISLSGLTNLYLGCRNFTSFVVSPSFASLSNLRLYNIELTANQVSELYNTNLGLSVDLHPSGITESTDVILNFKNLENSGNTLYNSATLGVGKDIQLYLNPNFINGPIGQDSHGVFLPSFDPTSPGTLGNQRSIRFEMSHNWKTGTPIDLHMHISTNVPILSGQTIIFSLERTFQDISMVLKGSTLNIIDSGRTYPHTTMTTYTFSPSITIPAYSNLILDFDNIDMSQYTTTSTSGIMTITRLTDTFPGSIFEVQSLRMHYEIDSIGSRQMYIK